MNVVAGEEWFFPENAPPNSEVFMVLVWKAILLWISLFGYCAYWKRHCHPAFAPLVTLSSIGVLMFLAGLLNVMLPAVVLILLGGFVCLALCKPWKKRFFSDQKMTFLLFGLFSVICLLFWIRIYGQLPTLYDCFSHWLTVVHEMLRTDALPTAASKLIEFQGYPTGTAGFLYFVCRVLGTVRDDWVLFSQSLLYAAFLTSFSAFVKRNNVFAIPFAAAGAMFCLTFRLTLFDLLVDTLIPMLGVAAVAILWFERENLWRGVLVSLPLQLFLVTVKNSGILMVVFTFLWILALAVLQGKREGKKVRLPRLFSMGAVSLGLPVALFVWWETHVKVAFPDGALSKHTFSVENYSAVLGSKTKEQILEILQLFWGRFTSRNDAWIVLLISFLILLVGWWVKGRMDHRRGKEEALIATAVVGVYLVYMIALAAMYLVSMPYGESVILAGYERYQTTILTYIIGLVTLYGLVLLGRFSHSAKEILISLFLFLLLFSSLFLQRSNVKKLIVKTDEYGASSRFELEQIKAEYGLEEGKRYFVYSDRHSQDMGYHLYLTRYLFWSTDVILCTPAEWEYKEDKLRDCDYLVIADYDDRITEYLSKHSVKAGERVYRTKELTNQKSE